MNSHLGLSDSKVNAFNSMVNHTSLIFLCSWKGDLPIGTSHWKSQLTALDNS